MRKGITLIEILIAISLLSMLSVGVLIAMRLGFTTMARTDDHLLRNRRVVNARRIIESEIQGFTLTKAEWQQQQIPFVEWAPDHMRFVTAYSLQDAWRGRPQIAEFQVIPGEKGAGVRLIMNETPYTGAIQTGQHIARIDTEPHFTAIAPGPNSFVLADKLEYCRFLYQQTDPQQLLRWFPEWKEPFRLPLGIRIEMAGERATDLVLKLNATPDPRGYSDVN